MLDEYCYFPNYRSIDFMNSLIVEIVHSFKYSCERKGYPEDIGKGSFQRYG